MLITAIILFLLAILFGLITLISILEERPNHKRVALLHGIIAATAILLVLIYMLIYGTSPYLIISLILLVSAALGGLTLFMLDMKKRPIPKLLVILHPVIAVAGVIALIIQVLP